MHIKLYVRQQTSVCANSLKRDGIVRGEVDDNYVLEFIQPTCSMSLGGNCSGHFNQVVFAVYLVNIHTTTHNTFAMWG